MDPVSPSAPMTQESVGSVPERGGTPTYEQITDQLKASATDPVDTTPAEPIAPETPEATPTPPAPTQAEQDEFRTMTDEEISALPQELQREAKALRKRFQSAYTKKTMDLAEIRRKAEIVDRFDSDPAFQEQVIQQAMARRGGQPAQPQAPATTEVPLAILKMVQDRLPAELQWMAPAQAGIAWELVRTMNQNVIQPLQQNVTAMQRQRQEQEYSTTLNEFAGRNPGWEAHEDAMVEVLEFLKSPALTHPKWGTKHDLLYRLAQGTEKVEQKAVETVLERTNRAVKTRSITASGAGRGTVSNLDDRIRDRKVSDDEAWSLIKAQHGSGG